MSDDYTYLPPADPADTPLDLEYTYDGPPVELVRPGELAQLRAERDAMRADLDLLCGWLDAVTGGLSVQELAQLPNVCAEVRQRWGLDG